MQVGQAFPPANSKCLRADGFLIGIQSSRSRLFFLLLGVLAGSLPKSRFGLAGGNACPTLTPGQSFVALDREMDKAAFGPVWLRDPRVAKVVADAILHGDSVRQFYQLRAWVIMPNHVHILLRPQTQLPVITRWLKGSTARQAKLILGPDGESRFGKMNRSIIAWRSDFELDRIVRYMEQNPVNAGSCQHSHRLAMV